jgi:hypothetical protein
MGPLLLFRGCHSGAWHLSVLIATESAAEPPALVSAGGTWAAERLGEGPAHRLWRYDFALPLEGDAKQRSYTIGPRSWAVEIPSAGAELRIAFTACNGSEHGDAWPSSAERNARWLHVAEKHARAPFHLLLQGGDQLYADPIWHDVPALAAWRRLPARERAKAQFTPEMAKGVDAFYFESYRRLWSQPELAALLATVPSLMMWDDHDILDGWGSYSSKWKDCAVLQGIWRSARKHFALFQLGSDPDATPPGYADRQGAHFGWVYRIGDVGLIAPDLRSERTRKQIMGEAGLRDFSAMLNQLEGCRHVLLVCTVPLVNAHLTTLERIFAAIPGHQALQDDLIDQWVSLAHWEEWGAFLATLLRFSARTGARVTSLSGEIHLGAFGLIEGLGAKVHQLVSSGTVHPPPSPAVAKLLELTSKGEFRVTPEIRAKLVPIPRLSTRYLRARNWLELSLPEPGHLLARWHAEGSETPLSVSIPPGAS